MVSRLPFRLPAAIADPVLGDLAGGFRFGEFGADLGAVAVDAAVGERKEGSR